MHALGLPSHHLLSECRRLDIRNLQILPEHVPILAQLSSVQVLQHSDFQVGPRHTLPVAARPPILMHPGSLWMVHWGLRQRLGCAILMAESKEHGPLNLSWAGSVALRQALLQHDTTRELTRCPAAVVPRQP